MREIDSDPALILQTLVSGAHLSKRHDETWREIVADGFRIDEKVDILGDSDDDPLAVARSLSRAVSGCAEALERLRPDVLVVLGDRYEVLGAAAAAMMLRIPIAHIHGGESSEGAIDEAIRHAVTKMAHIHFAAAEPYAQRIIQMGEDPARVFCTGAPGLDGIDDELLERAAFERETGYRLRSVNFLVTYHPVTLSDTASLRGMSALLAALDRFPDAGILITKSNADVGARALDRAVEEFASARADRVKLVTTLGSRLYRAALHLADVVVGNSSSGIIEAPAVGTPTVNIGSRQQGRLRAASVIDCDDDSDSIEIAMRRALSSDMRRIAEARETPYGRGNSSRSIKEVLKSIELAGLLTKHFFDIPVAARL